MFFLSVFSSSIREAPNTRREASSGENREKKWPCTCDFTRPFFLEGLLLVLGPGYWSRDKKNLSFQTSHIRTVYSKWRPHKTFDVSAISAKKVNYLDSNAAFSIMVKWITWYSSPFLDFLVNIGRSTSSEFPQDCFIRVPRNIFVASF